MVSSFMSIVCTEIGVHQYKMEDRKVLVMTANLGSIFDEVIYIVVLCNCNAEVCYSNFST